MRAKRREGLATKTIQNQLSFLNAIFVFAIKGGWANSNPVAHVERPRAAQTRSGDCASCNRPS